VSVFNRTINAQALVEVDATGQVMARPKRGNGKQSSSSQLAGVCWHNEMWRVSEFVLPDGSKLRRHGNFETAQAAHEAWKKLCLQHRGGIYQLAKGNKSGSVQCQCGEDCKCGFEVKGVLLEQLNAKGWWSPKPDQVWIGRELIRDECMPFCLSFLEKRDASWVTRWPKLATWLRTLWRPGAQEQRGAVRPTDWVASTKPIATSCVIAHVPMG